MPCHSHFTKALYFSYKILVMATADFTRARFASKGRRWGWWRSPNSGMEWKLFHIPCHSYYCLKFKRLIQTIRELHFSPCFSADAFYAHRHVENIGSPWAAINVMHIATQLPTSRLSLPQFPCCTVELDPYLMNWGGKKESIWEKTKIVGHSGVVAPFISCKSLRLL